MPMQKKVTRKDDGRYLIYYHFPETATAEETAAFDAVEGTSEELPDDSPSVGVVPETEAVRV